MIIIIIIRRRRRRRRNNNNNKPIKSPDQHNTYKFLGVFENTKQEDKQVLEAAAKTYLRRLSIIWSSPLLDHAQVVVSNQYALPVLAYLMWTQTWPMANIQQLDREGRKIIVESGGNHPKGSTEILYKTSCTRLRGWLEFLFYSEPWQRVLRFFRGKVNL